jgi:hypothetical protein
MITIMFSLCQILKSKDHKYLYIKIVTISPNFSCILNFFSSNLCDEKEGLEIAHTIVKYEIK